MSDRPLVFDLPVVPVEHLHERLGMEKPVVQPPSSRAKVRTLDLLEGEREGEGRRRYSRTYTRRRRPIAQAGGLVLWHDFCPIPEVLAASPSIVGLIEAVRDHWSFIESHMADLFCVEPSWLLVGVRGDSALV